MQRKFRSDTAAHNFAKVMNYDWRRGKKCKLKDGTAAHWYTLTKRKTKKTVKRRR